MRVTVLGTRGSMAVSNEKMREFGGATSSYMVEEDGEVEGKFPFYTLLPHEKIHFARTKKSHGNAEVGEGVQYFYRPFVAPAPVGVDDDRASMTRYHTG